MGDLVIEPLVGDVPEDEHAALLARLPGAMFAISHGREGIFVPGGLAAHLGMDRSMRHARLEDVVDPPHLATVLALLSRQVPPAVPQATPLRLTAADDGPVDVLATCRRVVDAPLLAFVEAPGENGDDEEVRHREQLLQEAERVAHLGSWSWDIAADTVTWSDGLYRMYGYEPGEIDVTLSTVLDHTIEEDRDYTRSVIEHGLATQLPFTYSHRVRQRDGDVRVLHSRGAVAEIDDTGRPRYMVGVCQDVTEAQDLRSQGQQFRELYERERAVASRLREVDELKDALVAAVSHDLRTPLAVIVGSVGTLRDLGRDIDPDIARTLLDNAIEHANRLHAMLSDLLDLDRLRRGGIRPRYRTTSLLELARGVLASGGYDTSRVELVEPRDDVIADVDAPKVERIVENLVRNALRHTPAEAAVWVRIDADAHWATITVEDDGPGVPETMRDRIFEPFERGAAMAIVPSGSGLGLAIVRRFARLHGGGAWVDERPGGGASFHVRLPLRHR
jgi:PAS domain S-box-containing protein